MLRPRVEWRVTDSDQQSTVASAAYHLLQNTSNLPGTSEDGQIDAVALTDWLHEVRRLCQEYGRSVTGDQCLGQLLARAPEDKNGVWPCIEVCEAMEVIASPEIAKGFAMGVYNSRGVHWREKGGDQERELAAKYRAWADCLHFEYPYMGATLEDIARSYEREAQWEDSRANVEKRLRE